MIQTTTKEGDLYWSISNPNDITPVMLLKNECPSSNYALALNGRTLLVEMISIYKLFLTKEEAEEVAITAFETQDEYIYFNSVKRKWVNSWDMDMKMSGMT